MSTNFYSILSSIYIRFVPETFLVYDDKNKDIWWYKKLIVSISYVCLFIYFQVSYVGDIVQKLENMQWTIHQVEMDLKRLPDKPSA